MDIAKLQTKRDEIVKNYRASVKRIAATDLTVLAELPEPYHYHVGDNGNNEFHVFLTYPASFATRDAIIAILQQNGFQKSSSWDDARSFCDMFYTHNLGVWLTWSLNLEGATCVRRMIGTETVEKEIYEIVCADSAAEKII